MEQDKTNEINSMTKLRPHSTAAFHTDQTQRSRIQHRTGYGLKDYTGPNKSTGGCSFCGSSHRASDCPKHINVNDRLEVAKRKGLCFNYLQSCIVFCRSMRKRNVPEVRQKASHSSSKRIGEKKKEDTAKTEEVQPNFTYANQSGILKTFMATVANGNKTVKAAVLLDDGTSDTFCTLNLAQKLQLPTTSNQRLSISHFGSEDKTDKSYNISPITLKTNEGHVHLKAIVVPKICTPKVRQPYRYRKEGQLNDKPIVEPINNGKEIDLLIASDFYYSVVIDGIIQLNNGTVCSRNQSWISCLWWPTQCSTDRQLLHNNTNRSHCYIQ